MTFDVVVVGGGPVGGTLAAALGVAGFNVALVEARAARPTGRESLAGDVFEPRVSSITCGSQRILDSLEIWPHLPSDRVGVIREMHVWEREGVGEIHFDAADIGEPCLGYIVENAVLEAAIERRLATLDSVTLVRGQRLHDVHVRDASVTVELEATRLDTQLVVGADGSHSAVREKLGIDVVRRAYEQRAVVSVVRCENGHKETAWQRFLPGGPIALLPLPGDRCCVVWSMPEETAEELLRASDTSFATQLGIATQSRLGEFLEVGPRAAFPLHALSAKEYVRDHVALVGDAAHTIHPLAGQGVNLGLYDAAALAETLEDARRKGRALHAFSTLRRYERWRRGHNSAVQSMMDLFVGLFGTNTAAVEKLRNLGLAQVNCLTPVKNLVMRHASGLSGDLPARSRRRRSGAQPSPVSLGD